MSYHKILIVGNLGRDPEMRFTPAGQAVCNFNVASNRQYTNGNGETIKETCWFRISTWGKTAENCNQYLRKGSQVLVEGRLACTDAGGPRMWQDADGAWRASFEVSAQNVRFLSRAPDNGAQEVVEGDPASEEDIPF